MRVSLSPHAATALAERGIAREWVERALAAPEREAPDAVHPDRRLAFRRIEEFGGRWLRVVYTGNGDERRVITALFDRRAGRRG